MNTLDSISKEKKSLLKRIAEIDSMRKGSINEQIIKTNHKNGSTKDNGPYYILTAKNKNGKTVSESIPKEKLDFFRQEIENYKEYKDLTSRFENLSEESSKIKSSCGYENEKLKKNRKSK